MSASSSLESISCPATVSEIYGSTAKLVYIDPIARPDLVGKYKWVSLVEIPEGAVVGDVVTVSFKMSVSRIGRSIWVIKSIDNIPQNIYWPSDETYIK